MSDPLYELFAKYEKKLRLVSYKPHKGKKGGQAYFVVRHTRPGSIRTVVRKVLSKMHLKKVI